MKVFKRLLETDADSFRGKLYLLLLDKLVIGAILALAFLIYDHYRAADVRRSKQNRQEEAWRFQKQMANLSHQLEVERSEFAEQREDRAAQIQYDFERARLAKDLLPFILDEQSSVIARGYALRSALTTQLLDPEDAIELGHILHTQGIPDDDLRRILNSAMPEGIYALARQGDRLRKEWLDHGEHPGTVYGSDNLPSERQHLLSVIKEWNVWRSVAMDLIAELETPSGHRATTRHDVAALATGLYFLLQSGGEHASTELFESTNRTIRLLGGLDCMVNDWGPQVEAAKFISEEFSTLDFTKLEDVIHAQAILDVLYVYGPNKTDDGYLLSNSTSSYLAPLLATMHKILSEVSLVFERAFPKESIERNRARWLMGFEWELGDRRKPLEGNEGRVRIGYRRSWPLVATTAKGARL